MDSLDDDEFEQPNEWSSVSTKSATPSPTTSHMYIQDPEPRVEDL